MKQLDRPELVACCKWCNTQVPKRARKCPACGFALFRRKYGQYWNDRLQRWADFGRKPRRKEAMGIIPIDQRLRDQRDVTCLWLSFTAATILGHAGKNLVNRDDWVEASLICLLTKKALAGKPLVNDNDGAGVVLLRVVGEMKEQGYIVDTMLKLVPLELTGSGPYPNATIFFTALHLRALEQAWANYDRERVNR